MRARICELSRQTLGRADFALPHVPRAQSRVDASCDVWLLGVVLYLHFLGLGKFWTLLLFPRRPYRVVVLGARLYGARCSLVHVDHRPLAVCCTARFAV